MQQQPIIEASAYVNTLQDYIGTSIEKVCFHFTNIFSCWIQQNQYKPTRLLRPFNLEFLIERLNYEEFASGQVLDIAEAIELFDEISNRISNDSSLEVIMTEGLSQAIAKFAECDGENKWSITVDGTDYTCWRNLQFAFNPGFENPSTYTPENLGTDRATLRERFAKDLFEVIKRELKKPETQYHEDDQKISVVIKAPNPEGEGDIAYGASFIDALQEVAAENGWSLSTHTCTSEGRRGASPVSKLIPGGEYSMILSPLPKERS